MCCRQEVFIGNPHLKFYFLILLMSTVDILALVVMPPEVGVELSSLGTFPVCVLVLHLLLYLDSIIPDNVCKDLLGM